MNSALSFIRRTIEPIAVKTLLTWERLESGIAFHPGSDQTTQRPYELYAEMRERDPVHRMRLINAWALTKYTHVDMVLRDYRRFSNNVPWVLKRTGYTSMIQKDPPDHTRLRSLVVQAFQRRHVHEHRANIEKIADDLLDRVKGKRRFELMSTLAYPLPISVVAGYIGVPAEDMEQFSEWSTDMALQVELQLDEDGIRRVRNARNALLAYFNRMIEMRRKKPEDDLITALIAAKEGSDTLTHNEMVGILIILLVAGNESSQIMIASGVLALCNFPDQMERLRQHPELMDSAVQEILRYEAPTQLDIRYVLEDCEIGGKKIRKGQTLIPVLGSANRDPEAFKNPDDFDIGRKDAAKHLSFGRGIHYCLGSPLALVEGAVAFSALLERYSSIRAEEPARRNQALLRAINELWLDVAPAA